MKATKTFIKQYESALVALRERETVLAAALDRLQAARDAAIPSEITAAVPVAVRADHEVVQAMEIVERTRRAYWEFRRALAETALLDAGLPLMAEIERCARAAPTAGTHHSVIALQRLAALPRPEYATDGDLLPTEPLESAVLDRSDGEI